MKQLTPDLGKHITDRKRDWNEEKTLPVRSGDFGDFQPCTSLSEQSNLRHSSVITNSTRGDIWQPEATLGINSFVNSYRGQRQKTVLCTTIYL